MTAMLKGFALAFSLILAIGAQNAFVLRTGLRGHHVFAVCAFCALSDMILIILGIGGMAALLTPFQAQIFWIYIVAALWLAGYGVMRLKDAMSGAAGLTIEQNIPSGFWPVMLTVAGLTWLNPHVYLDTVILLGGISVTLDAGEKIPFALGACLATCVFFFSLGYGGKALGKTLTSPKAWVRIDFGIALLMFWIAAGLVWAAFIQV